MPHRTIHDLPRISDSRLARLRHTMAHPHVQSALVELIERRAADKALAAEVPACTPLSSEELLQGQIAAAREPCSITAVPFLAKTWADSMLGSGPAYCTHEFRDDEYRPREPLAPDEVPHPTVGRREL